MPKPRRVTESADAQERVPPGADATSCDPPARGAGGMRSVVKAAGKYRYRLTIRGGTDALIRALVTKILNYCNREREFRGISVYADRNPLE